MTAKQLRMISKPSSAARAAVGDPPPYERCREHEKLFRYASLLVLLSMAPGCMNEELRRQRLRDVAAEDLECRSTKVEVQKKGSGRAGDISYGATACGKSAYYTFYSCSDSDLANECRLQRDREPAQITTMVSAQCRAVGDVVAEGEASSVEDRVRLARYMLAKHAAALGGTHVILQMNNASLGSVVLSGQAYVCP